MTRRAPEWDVVVVGGGPAGSATAIRLARQGQRVLLLDRDHFPRDKPCGECVSPAGVRALEALGVLPRVLAAAHAPLGGWRIHAGEGRSFEGRFPAGERGIGIPRSRLDGILLDAARESGVEVRTGWRVADLLRQNGRVTGVLAGQGSARHRLSARLVVGADGLRSVVVRRSGLLRRRPRLRKLALTAHVRGVHGLDGSGELHLHPWGCVGVARVDHEQANVTVVVTGAEAERVAGARAFYFDSVLARFPGAVRVGEVLATGPFDWPTRAVTADGVMLVGDAAGYYDPFTGQGIFRALRGAELAAEAAEAALRTGDSSARALAPYQRAHRLAFAPGERLQHLIEAFVSRPRLLGWAATRLRRRPELADALIAVTGDLSPVRSLFTPLRVAQLLW